MRNANVLKGVAFLAAAMLMGAGCSASGTVTPPVGGDVDINVGGTGSAEGSAGAGY